MKKQLLFLVFLGLICFTVRAEVYSLWPFARGASGDTPFYSAEDPAAAFAIPQKAFWTEPILADGKTLTLHISLVDMPFEEAVLRMRKACPDAQTAASSDSLLMSIPRKDGSLQRFWLMALKGVHPVLMFSMTIPAAEKNNPSAAWPDSIPLLSGAVDRHVMTFPSRKSDFATYRVPGVTRAQALHEMDQKLRLAGWNPASGEIADPFRASGEVYLREKPLQVLLLGASEPGEYGVTVTVYTRPIENAK